MCSCGYVCAVEEHEMNETFIRLLSVAGVILGAGGFVWFFLWLNDTKEIDQGDCDE